MENNCAICLDGTNNSNYNEKIINSKDYVLRERCDSYRFSCECNISIHPKCITSWLKKNNKCPICLVSAEKQVGCVSDACLNSFIIIIGYMLILHGIFFVFFYNDDSDAYIGHIV